MNKKVNVIGAGLAGCEAAWQIASLGIEVNLYEMKPKKFSPAHKSSDLCELVCSNSFKADRLESASGLLKEEMRVLNSLILSCADKCRVPAGGALAVDREKFSKLVTEKIKSNKFISLISNEVNKIDLNEITIVATGPLTSDTLSEEIKNICGGYLSFFDAAAPIVTAESINMDKAFFASRYGRGNPEDYLNCPLSKEEYEIFYNELVNAERAKLHDVDKVNVYEGCMPVEIMAARGFDTLRYGPMKPVGLKNPKSEEKPFAVVQLRKETVSGELYNMVGFQTNLKFQEQKRVFGLIPALENLEIVRCGVMHRNTFINSPKLLNRDYSMRSIPNLFFAGQITGVEGYIESASSGLVAGRSVAMKILQNKCFELPKSTMIGALAGYISDESVKNFQPMGANFGIIDPLEEKIKDKKERYKKISEKSIEILKGLK